jgi:uncharacterized protein (DUF1499 family)
MKTTPFVVFAAFQRTLNMEWSKYGALLGLGLAASALLLLAVAPIGWRAGWWHFRFAFSWLMTSSGLLALAAVIVALLSLALGWATLDTTVVAMGLIALILGAVLVYVPWQYNRTRSTVPRIHDITTDTENPPEFVAALPARAAENAATVVYEGVELAKIQKAAYPDVAPLKVPWTTAKAFEQALEVTKSMQGWTIISFDPSAGRIEASQASRWFRFVDDIVIRVTADGSGSRVDMRSLSRQGRSDFGVNAARIRAYMGELKKRIG